MLMINLNVSYFYTIMLSKLFKFVKENRSEIILFLCVLLISSFSFSFGYIIGKTQEKPSLEFHEPIKNEEMERGIDINL